MVWMSGRCSCLCCTARTTDKLACPSSAYEASSEAFSHFSWDWTTLLLHEQAGLPSLEAQKAYPKLPRWRANVCRQGVTSVSPTSSTSQRMSLGQRRPHLITCIVEMRHAICMPEEPYSVTMWVFTVLAELCMENYITSVATVTKDMQCFVKAVSSQNPWCCQTTLPARTRSNRKRTEGPEMFLGQLQSEWGAA